MGQAVQKFCWWECYDCVDWFFLRMTSVWFVQSILAVSGAVVVASILITRKEIHSSSTLT